MIYSVANQIRTFIFPSVAIYLRWALIWAGSGSLGLGQNVPGHSWARLPVGGYRARQLKYLANVIHTARVPETQINSEHAMKPVLSNSPGYLPLCLTACLRWTGHDWITAWEIIMLLKNRHRAEGLNQSTVTSERQESYLRRRRGKGKHIYASKFCYLHVIA